MKDKSLLAVAPLFLVLCIDGMGLGLLFPILNGIIIDPNTQFLAAGTTDFTRSILYGGIVGIFMICWFFGAAIFGDLSDNVGRKKALMICLVGAFIGYFLSAIAIIIKSLSLLIFGRIIAGFTAGSQPIAQAAIVDVSSDKHKARNIGLILLACSIGFVIGPIIGTVLSNDHLVSWFNMSTPLYFASFISLLNAIFLWFLFQETFDRTEAVNIRWHHAIHIFVSAFTRDSIRKLSYMMLVMIFGWSSYFTFIPMYLTHTYQFSTQDNGLFMALLGAGFATGCGWLVDFCSKRYKLTYSVMAGLIVTTLAIIATAFTKPVIITWICAYIIGTSLSLAYSTIITVFSVQVGPEEQGWVMGVTGSIMALCFGLTSLFIGLAAYMGPDIPLYMAIAGLAISTVMMYRIHDQVRETI